MALIYEHFVSAWYRIGELVKVLTDAKIWKIHEISLKPNISISILVTLINTLERIIGSEEMSAHWILFL